MIASIHKIIEQLNIEQNDWESIKQININKGIVKVEKESEPLFVRLNADTEINYLKELIDGDKKMIRKITKNKRFNFPLQ